MADNITRDKDQLVTQIADLDFFAVRQNFVNFLKNQSQFSDQNFEGSNFSVLLDVLAYNTHYLAFYLNAIASESFLTTATQRGSVVARAKGLGYIPRSVRAATAGITLNLGFTGQGIPPAFIPVPIGTRFAAQLNGKRVSFVTTTGYTAVQRTDYPDVYSVDLEIKEGTFITQQASIDSNNVSAPIRLLNKNIDTTTLVVNVFPTPTSDAIAYLPVFSVTSLNPTSRVFFLEEVDGLLYNITFGDGILGAPIASGNLIEVKYLVSQGPIANGASTFTLNSVVPNAILTTNPNFDGIAVNNAADGGTEIESVQSVKRNAPLAWQAQERTVTAADYAALVKDNFPFVDAIAVWGGETNVPVALGYVFLSILPTNGAILLSEQEKIDIETFLQTNAAVLNITPIVVDPDYTYIKIKSTVVYPAKLLTLDPADIESDVQDAAVAFNKSFLTFGNYFRYSKLVRVIDQANVNINSSLTDVFVQKNIDVSNQAPESYSAQFYNPLDPGTLDSSRFTYTNPVTPETVTGAFFNDDGNGVVQVAHVVSNVVTVINPNAGSIDYISGALILTDVMVEPALNSTTPFETVKIWARPVKDDIISQRQAILIIDPSDVAVSAVPDRT